MDVEAAKPWLRARGRPEDAPRTELVRKPDVLAEIQRAVVPVAR